MCSLLVLPSVDQNSRASGTAAERQRSCSGVAQHSWLSCPTSEGKGKGCYKGCYKGGGERGEELSRPRRCASCTKRKKKKKQGEGKKKSLKSAGAGEASSAHFKVVAPGAVFICAPAQAAPRSRGRSQWRGRGGALRPALRCASPALLLRPCAGMRLRGGDEWVVGLQGAEQHLALQSMLRLQETRSKQSI